MKRIPAAIRKAIHEEAGQGLTEYLLMLTLVAVGLVSLVGLIRGPVTLFLQAAITALRGMTPS
ncbi:MAG TPA: hypothetical protein VNT75_25555 [Symbiobacteriaceae bacterium]|nr:hypothetical protein [Symbiobacteriaceae bacterium]